MVRRNPLRDWFDQFPRPMLQKDFAQLAGISQSFLTSLLSDTPPWPARRVMREITKLTKGKVTANDWVQMEDPPSRAAIKPPPEPEPAADTAGRPLRRSASPGRARA